MEPTTAAPKPKEQGAEWAYEAIAPVYDDFTAHHDYELWLDNLLPKLRRHGLRGNRLLDVACGTGKSFLSLLERGWDVTACDISPSMLEVAREKVGGAAELSVADMRELPEFGQFDFVSALDDAVNYLLSAEELEMALAAMGRNLASHGLLMFDVNTLCTYRTFFAETEVVERGGRRLIWRGQASPDTEPGSICESHFEVEEVAGETGGGEGTLVASHTHRQRHFPEEEVLQALERAGLECLGVYGHGYDAVPERPLEELTHTKAVYIAGLA